MEMDITINYIRYQEQPLHKRIYLWLRYMPYAWIRGIYWYVSQLWKNRFTDDGIWYHTENLHFCIGVSIGDVQATKMHWIYSAEEVMQYLNKKRK